MQSEGVFAWTGKLKAQPLTHTPACTHASFILSHIRCPCKAIALAEWTHTQHTHTHRHVLYVHMDSVARWGKGRAGFLPLVNRMRSREMEAGALVSSGPALGFPPEDRKGKYNTIKIDSLCSKYWYGPRRGGRGEICIEFPAYCAPRVFSFIHVDLCLTQVFYCIFLSRLPQGNNNINKASWCGVICW